MGDGSGPHAHYVRYSVHSGVVTVEHSTGEIEEVHQGFFEYLDTQLRERTTGCEGSVIGSGMVPSWSE